MLKNQVNTRRIYQLLQELDDPLLDNKDLEEKLQAFLDYAKEIPNLPEVRKRYRIQKSLEMIEKLRSWFLIDYLECSGEEVDLSTDIQYAKGVGPNRKKKLKKLGIETLRDLLEFSQGITKTEGRSSN